MFCRQSTVLWCLKFIPICCMGPKHVHVVQIWIMHINALKTQLMHKNVQTNPEKSQKLTQHFCCSMLTLENIWKQ